MEKPMQSFFIPLIASVLSLSASESFAWGKRGHEIVAVVASRLVWKNEGTRFFRSHSYDLGYYSNVPDIIWRNMGEEINKIEAPLHFIDWENYSSKSGFKTLPKEFKAAKEKMGPEFKRDWGLVPWRIQQFYRDCASIASELKGHGGKLPFSALHARQEEFLVCLGAMGHYIGDISMPLHTSVNYDGEQTAQKGIHAFFETELLDFFGADLQQDVERRALDLWEARSKAAGEDVFERTMTQISQSHGRIAELLKIDRSLKREDLKEAASKFRNMLVEQLSEGALNLAVTWKKLSQGIQFDEKRFYNFSSAPNYRRPDFEGDN